jgi:hypothetical protein
MSILIPTLPGLRRLAASVVAFAVAALVVPSPLQAATLAFDAAMRIQPEESAPAVGELPAGTNISSLLREELSAAGLAQPPPGWIAIRSPGPFTGFVPNRDVQDDGTIRTGAEIRAQPLPDAPLLLIVEEGDQTEASEPMGDWSRASIRTDLIVFVNALPPESRSQAAPGEEATSPAPEAEVALEEAAPAPERPRKVRKPRRERTPKPPREAKVDPTPVETAGAPRTFEGYLMRNRRWFGRAKYDYQLVDENNKRIALLDLSSLSSGAQLDAFENRRVSVYGPGLSRPDVSDPIIRVETLRLLQ